MLPLPPYHIIYLIVKLSQINLTLIMFEDYSISIRPFINTNLKHPRYPPNTITRPILLKITNFGVYF
jgi:hypothetical protein